MHMSSLRMRSRLLRPCMASHRFCWLAPVLSRLGSLQAGEACLGQEQLCNPHSEEEPLPVLGAINVWMANPAPCPLQG